MSDVFTLRGPIKKDRPALAKRSAARKNLAGDVLGTVDLDPSIFGLVPNMAVLHQVVNAQLAARRAGTQSTKTRKEVRGGGRKPSTKRAAVERVREPSVRRTTPVVELRSDPSRASTTKRRRRK